MSERESLLEAHRQRATELLRDMDECRDWTPAQIREAAGELRWFMALSATRAPKEMPCFCGSKDAYRCPAHINPVQFTSGGR